MRAAQVAAWVVRGGGWVMRGGGWWHVAPHDVMRFEWAPSLDLICSELRSGRPRYCPPLSPCTHRVDALRPYIHPLGGARGNTPQTARDERLFTLTLTLTCIPTPTLTLTLIQASSGGPTRH